MLNCQFYDTTFIINNNKFFYEVKISTISPNDAYLIINQYWTSYL